MIEEVGDEDDQILDAIVIEDDDEEGNEKGDLHFLDTMLKSEENVRKGNELLLKAVRTFE